jgi:hypothetical protein
MVDGFRWRLAEDDGGQGALFDEGPAAWQRGVGEFRGMEFLHVNARTIINEIPKASMLPFRWTINAYRGCSHACSYCASGETAVLMADGRTRRLVDLRPGDRIYGTVRRGAYHRYTPTTVRAHWSTFKRAYRITLEDRTELIASGDHRFLSNRGWKFVTGAYGGPNPRPHLTTTNSLLGTGKFAEAPKQGPDYQQGYLCGIIRGDGTIGHYPTRRGSTVHGFRLALVDVEALRRAREYLSARGVVTREFQFSSAGPTTHAMRAIRCGSMDSVHAIERIIDLPTVPSADGSCAFQTLTPRSWAQSPHAWTDSTLISSSSRLGRTASQTSDFAEAYKHNSGSFTQPIQQ